MCKPLWVSLAISLAGACGAPVGQATQDFLAAERKFDDQGNTQSRIMSVVGNVMAQVSPFTEGRIRNVRLTSDIPRILTIDPNYAHLNLLVIASLGTIVIEGEVNISSLLNLSSFSGNITITYGNVSASGVAAIAAVHGVLEVIQLDLMYSPQNRLARVATSGTQDKYLGELAQTFFEDSVERLVAGELYMRVARQLNEVLKGVNSLEVFGDSADMKRAQDFNPVGNANLMVDNLLAMMLPRIPASVSLDDVNSSFKRTFLFVPIFGQLATTNGTLRDLKTLRRTSDVFLNVTSSGIRLTGAMGLETLQFAYDYDISVLHLGPSGRLEGTAGNISLSFALKVTYDDRGSCTVNIEELHVQRIGNFKIKVTGFGILNWLASSITTSVVKDAEDKIIAHIEASLKRNLKNAADKIGFCNVLQGQ